MKNKNLIIVFVSLFVLAVLSRFVSHMWNFTLVGGAFIFAGAYFKDKKISLALMLLTMLVSDYFIGFHNQMLSVYFSYLVMVLVGSLLKTDDSRVKKTGFSLLATTLFFVFTNFAVWFEGSLYPTTFSGLVDCFTMAIPFYRNQLFGDVLSALVFFEVGALAAKHLAVSTAEVTKK